MSQSDAYLLNEAQLELVSNLPYYAALSMFKEPLTPSEAARRLRVPANVMHYHVKRLLEAGLLERTEEGGRGHLYKSVSQRFSVAPEVLPAATEALPAMLDTMLSKLHRNFLGRTEAELRDIDALLEAGPVVFELNESLTLGSVEPHDYPTWVSIATVELSAEQFQRFTDAVRGILDEAKADRGEKRCTLAFLAFQGQGAM